MSVPLLLQPAMRAKKREVDMTASDSWLHGVHAPLAASAAVAASTHAPSATTLAPMQRAAQRLGKVRPSALHTRAGAAVQPQSRAGLGAGVATGSSLQGPGATRLTPTHWARHCVEDHHVLSCLFNRKFEGPSDMK